MNGSLCAVVLALSASALLTLHAPQAQEKTFLRWPHEQKGLSDAEREALRASVWLVNNFGLYQAGATPESVYFHDGLDIVLPNGTPIYGITSGHVRAISGTPPYRQIIVEDADHPGRAWQYVHISGDTLRVGDFVEDGARLAVVDFRGLEHIHLNRMFLEEGGRWTDPYSLNFVQSIHLFDIRDDEPPTIQTPFRYFLNDSDDELRNGSPARVSGAIDVVVGMRDGGHYAHGKLGSLRSYGDRLAPQRAEISIAPASSPDQPVWTHVGFDFARLILGFRRGVGLRDPDNVFTIFKYRPVVDPAPPGNYNQILNYYVMTNLGNDATEPRRMHPSDSAPGWDTAARDAHGRGLYPDGEYVITVRAWDAHENMAVARDRVIVQNR